jgi:hypothetical protein
MIAAVQVSLIARHRFAAVLRLSSWIEAPVEKQRNHHRFLHASCNPEDGI